jgi:hypothetical protein
VPTFRSNILFPSSDYDKLVRQGAGIINVIMAVLRRVPERVGF